MFSTLPSTPILIASTGMSSSRQRAWSATQSESIASTPSTPSGVLHGDRGHDRQRMAAHAGERQHVGLQPGAARGIRAGKRQDDRRDFEWRVGSICGLGPGAAIRVDVNASRVRDCYDFEFYSNRISSRAGFTRASTASRRNHAMKKYMCLICGWIYDEAAGAPGRRHRARDKVGRSPAELDSALNAARGRKTSR